MLDDLPGTPDNLDRDPDGRMLIALYDRTAALDALVVPNDLARHIMIRLPGGLFVNEEDPLTGGILVADDDGVVTAHHTGLAPAATSENKSRVRDNAHNELHSRNFGSAAAFEAPPAGFEPTTCGLEVVPRRCDLAL